MFSLLHPETGNNLGVKVSQLKHTLRAYNVTCPCYVHQIRLILNWFTKLYQAISQFKRGLKTFRKPAVSTPMGLLQGMSKTCLPACIQR